MTDPERIHAVKRAAQESLLVLPGVHAVGVGPKLVRGKPSGELAIKVYLVRKKPLTELTADEVIPSEIDGVKTDVVEMDVPNLHDDFSKERPLILGTATRAKNAPEGGTLGFLARTHDIQPKLVAITCQHVVAPLMGAAASKLMASTPEGTPNPYKIILLGSNTPGSVVLVKMASPGQKKRFTAFWTTTDTDTLSSVATSVVAAVNGIAGVGVTAAIGTHPEDVIITRNAGADTIVGACSVYDPIIPDPKSKLFSSVAGNVVTLSGKTDGEYGIYTSWSTEGSEPSHGAFTRVIKDSALSVVANDIASAITALSIAGITATPSGATVTIGRAKRVLCQVTSDIRVGQPTDGFSSNCSLCCTDEIGRVLNAHMDLDVALVQLRRGIEYKDEIKGDDSIPKPNTVITGVHTVTDLEQRASYPVHKRGRNTLYTSGTVDSLDVSGYATSSPADNSWTVFYRFYDHAMLVVGNGGSQFSAPGDSGSAVFNNSGEIVGVLSTGAQRTVVTPIGQITGGLGVDVVTATALGQKQTVSDAEGALAMVRADGELVTQEVLEAQAEISATPAGRELADLVRRHAEEVQILVNTNSRVATAWHRNGGPRLVDAVFRYLQERTGSLPHELDGLSLTERLKNIQRALMKYGSEALSRDLERHGPRILALTRLSYSQMLAQMRGEPEAVPGS